MKRRLLALVTLCFALVGFSTAAGAAVSTFEGPIRAMTTKDLIPHYKSNSSNSWYYENYYFTSKLRGGITLAFHCKFSNVGLQNGKAVFITELKLPGKKKLYLATRLKKGEWDYKSDHFEVKVGDNSMSGKPGKLKVVFKNDTVSGWVEFTNTLRPWVPGTGRLKVGGKSYHYSLLAPRASVKGQLVLLKEGSKTIELKGSGQATHSYMTGGPHQLFKRWVRLEHIGSKHTIALSTIQVPSGQWASMLYIAKGRRVLVQRFDVLPKPLQVKVDTKHVNQYRVPIELLLSGSNGKPSIKGKIIAKKLISRADQLKDLNRFERFIVEKFAKPVYYRFNADYKIIFQVNGADETVEGTGVYVYQQLNK
ncbi:MAG: hypothetical protein KC609_26805 [Myxococcales bacterium]|nr:hypothetical protein [Myxococcales bacterium]